MRHGLEKKTKTKLSMQKVPSCLSKNNAENYWFGRSKARAKKNFPHTPNPVQQ